MMVNVAFHAVAAAAAAAAEEAVAAATKNPAKIFKWERAVDQPQLLTVFTISFHQDLKVMSLKIYSSSSFH